MDSSNASSSESSLVYNDNQQSPGGTTPCDRLGVDLMNVLEDSDEVKQEAAPVTDREIEDTESDASTGSSFASANELLGETNTKNETSVDANGGLTLTQQREMVARLTRVQRLSLIHI